MQETQSRERSGSLPEVTQQGRGCSVWCKGNPARPQSTHDQPAGAALGREVALESKTNKEKLGGQRQLAHLVKENFEAGKLPDRGRALAQAALGTCRPLQPRARPPSPIGSCPRGRDTARMGAGNDGPARPHRRHRASLALLHLGGHDAASCTAVWGGHRHASQGHRAPRRSHVLTLAGHAQRSPLRCPSSLSESWLKCFLPGETSLQPRGLRRLPSSQPHHFLFPCFPSCPDHMSICMRSFVGSPVYGVLPSQSRAFPQGVDYSFLSTCSGAVCSFWHVEEACVSQDKFGYAAATHIPRLYVRT
ncbi:uncharacterized protein LOC121043009 [Herpailurus yagouaroundi]|uniref:uncharacterized protein LOC121043009 n=1 Tax=Herpailurus yagouaroundi TaxID=1608482 RepID=UPI001AD7332C|nr:uncharacterized protein LOC121043009 [Puma yagouaroundi]